ncbi:hypothetical protein RHGRI_004008 [Rhododendron griersonianum]|uniref:Pectinesterase inhibitor domain-containing protein n=1 Tax=Rhododendron griersonianum TaxID=479676 RepID=A0AAV6L8U3_9ERIC|nr:hypothetical protein RHGRI_004008 [Rhododendron griersonianum]
MKSTKRLLLNSTGTPSRIADTCKKTDDSELCISTLRSDPLSKTADVKGLAGIVLKVLLVKYDDAIYEEIPEAIENLSKFAANEVIGGALTWEDTFNEEPNARKSPLTADNNMLIQLAAVAYKILASLG